MRCGSTHLRDDLETLSLRYVLAFGDGRLQLLQHPRIERLHKSIGARLLAGGTYRSAGNDQLHLSAVRAHKLAKLFAYSLERAEPVVLRQGVEEVLDDLAAAAGVLLQLDDDGFLVLGGQRRRGEDARQLGVPLEYLAEGIKRAGGRVENRSFGCGRVLRQESGRSAVNVV
jgi:hypothetical protein